jgi:hypothetical protein
VVVVAAAEVDEMVAVEVSTSCCYFFGFAYAPLNSVCSGYGGGGGGGYGGGGGGMYHSLLVFYRSLVFTYRTPFQAMEDAEDMMIAAAEVCSLLFRLVFFRSSSISPCVAQATVEVCDFYPVASLLLFSACFEHSTNAVQAMEEVCMFVHVFLLDGFVQRCIYFKFVVC